MSRSEDHITGTQNMSSRKNTERNPSLSSEMHSRTFNTSESSVSVKSRRFVESTYDRVTSLKELKSYDGDWLNGLVSLAKFLEGHGLYPILWNEILVVLCLIAVSLDPLFCYIFVIDEGKKCLELDHKLKYIAVVLRSVTDLVYFIFIIFHFQVGYIPPSSRTLRRGVWSKAWSYLLSYFPIDILAVLPLPQVLVLAVIPKLRGSSFVIVINLLKFLLFIQYVPRLLRIYSFLKKVRWSFGILPETGWAKATFNLFLYMLASHVVGAFWYLFSIERTITCWDRACGADHHCAFNCNESLRNNSFLNDLCSAKESNRKTDFDFGIFSDALKSGLLDSTDFIEKFSYCYLWGLQSLSSLGQSLKTSTYVWEIYFAALISISGLVLFALLIGNLQTYLQSKIARLEEMRLKAQDIELWMAFHSLPRNLKKRIKKYQRYKWQETRGADIENLLHNLPRDIQREIKRHLCMISLTKVSLLQNMDERLLDAICDYLKPVLYIEQSFIAREGEPLDEMIFICRGKLWIYTSNNNSGISESLDKGDFYGEELLSWALKHPFSSNVPISTKTVQAHTKVEAFSLMANDLRTVIEKFWWLFNKKLDHSPLFAAFAIQAAWRRHCKNKLERQSRLVMGEQKSSLGITVYASRFVAGTLGALRVRKALKANIVCTKV